jgi:NAD(P)-dependent dehydrogenase (short-subunit alcohol dehydrogenase family)
VISENPDTYMEVRLPNSHVTLICGGTAPIGANIALHLARAGAGSVIITGRDESRGADAVAALRQQVPTTSFNFIRADLREPKDAASMFEFVDSHCGGLDAYVHCIPPGAAGGSLVNADLDRFRSGVFVGLAALADMCRRAARAITGRGGGNILIFSSDAGRVASPGHSLVATIQSGVMALTRSLALELASDQIRVNCISPTYVRDTPLFDRLMQTPEIAGAIERAAKRAGLGLPAPTDIAPLATFLISPLASKITGQIISVNGGLSAA